MRFPKTFVCTHIELFHSSVTFSQYRIQYSYWAYKRLLNRDFRVYCTDKIKGWRSGFRQLLLLFMCSRGDAQRRRTEKVKPVGSVNLIKPIKRTRFVIRFIDVWNTFVRYKVVKNVYTCCVWTLHADTFRPADNNRRNTETKTLVVLYEMLNEYTVRKYKARSCQWL